MIDMKFHPPRGIPASRCAPRSTAQAGGPWQRAWGEWCLAVFLFSGFPLALQAADLTAYTEEWAPYNFSEDRVVKGIATDLLTEACALAKLHCDVQIVPWARAYRTAQNVPNTLVYSTARKPSREKEFLWVGPILPRTTWVFGNTTTDMQPKSLQDLAKLRIGVVREEAAQQDLINAGVPANALVAANSNAEVLRMLGAHMVDAMVDTEVGMQWNVRTSGQGQVAYRRLLKLSDEGAYYYALNLQTHPDLVQKLQAAVDKIRRSGRLDAIVRSYGASTASTPASSK